MLPTLLPTDRRYLICRNGLMGLLDMGRKFVNTAIWNPAIINAKGGKMGVLSSRGKSNIELYVTLNSVLWRASQWRNSVRYEIGTRRDRINYPRRLTQTTWYFHPIWAKHRCYARWCYKILCIGQCYEARAVFETQKIRKSISPNAEGRYPGS